MTDDALQTKLADIDMVDVVENYVELQPAGQDGQFIGICPFHDDHNPSMSVKQNADGQRGLFHCFTCGASGDVITFISKIEDTDFTGALKKLSELTGETFKMRELTAEEKHRQQRNILMEKLRDYMVHLLFSPVGVPYLKQVKARGLTEEEIRHFQLGYCDRTRLKNFFDANDIPLKEQLETKLVETKNDRVYYPLANRIIFPLKNLRGKVVGFSGGKTRDDMQPKYRHAVNLDDGSAFFYTKIASKKPFVIVEGFYDQISLELAGVENVIATLGTSAGASDNKVDELLQRNNNFVICMDGDLPGLKASFKMGQNLYRLNSFDDTQVRFVKLPSGLDPDDFRRKNGREELAKVYHQQHTLPEFKTLIDIDEAKQEGHSQEWMLKAGVQNLALAENKLQAEMFAKWLSKRFKVSVEAIQEAYQQQQAKRQRRQAKTKKKSSAASSISTPSHKPSQPTQPSTIDEFNEACWDNLSDQLNAVSPSAQSQAVYAEEQTIVAYILQHPTQLEMLLKQYSLLELKELFVTDSAFQSLGIISQFLKHFGLQQISVYNICRRLGNKYPVEQVYLQNLVGLSPTESDYQSALNALQTNGQQLSKRDKLLRDLQQGNGDPDKIVEELRRINSCEKAKN